MRAGFFSLILIRCYSNCVLIGLFIFLIWSVKVVFEKGFIICFVGK